MMNKVANQKNESGESGRGVRRRSVLIGWAALALVVGLILIFFIVDRNVKRKNIEIFKAAVERRDLAAAQEIASKIQKQYDTKRELQALALFNTEKAAFVAAVGADAILLETNDPEEWTQVLRRVEQAEAPGYPGKGAALFAEARLGVERIRMRIAGSIQFEVDFYKAWNMEEGRLEKYIPSMHQWFFFELKKVRIIKEPVEAGLVYKELLVKLEDAVRRAGVFQEKEQAMQRGKQRWLETADRLPSATVVLLETHTSFEWMAIQKRIKQAEADAGAARFVAAQAGYAAATGELEAMMQVGYLQSIEIARGAVAAMEWDLAYAALDQADRSGHSDLSEAKALRFRLDQLFSPMRTAEAAYKTVLATIDRDLLKKYGGTEWGTIWQLAERGASARDLQQGAYYFNQAASQLRALVYPLYLRGAKQAIDSGRWNEARNLVHMASLIRQSQELSMLQGQLPVLDKGTAWTAELGDGVSMDFVSISAGLFLMGGATGDPHAHSKSQVTFSQSFWMGKTEVTQAQYRQIMGENPSHFKGDRSPVEKISWDDAVRFCKKLTEYDRRSNRLPAGFEYMLPTEAQWEYVCRADTTGDFAGNLAAMGWYSLNSGGKTHPVATLQPNAWGLYDMHGNVWEWCSDWYGDYSFGQVTDPEGASWGTLRVFRGGSWNRYAMYCRSAYRSGENPTKSLSNLGFRVTVQKQKSDRR